MLHSSQDIRLLDIITIENKSKVKESKLNSKPFNGKTANPPETPNIDTKATEHAGHEAANAPVKTPAELINPPLPLADLAFRNL